MRPEILRQLLADREAKRTVVLTTNLKTGAEALLYPTEISDTDPDPVRRAAAEAARADRSGLVETADGKVFLHVYNPPLRLLVVGAVHIAQPLARMAVLAGYDVTIVDPRSAFASEERFPGVSLSEDWPDEALEALKPDRRTAVVTLTHDPKLDDPALAVTLRSEAFYIGALGSTRTHAKRLDRLREEGFGETDFQRIRGPVGLSIEAKSPAEIAIAILGQVTETLRRGNRTAS